MVAEEQVKISVCQSYMAGKISSRNFRDIITQRKSIIFNSKDKAIAGKQLIGTRIGHTEKPLACSSYHIFCRPGQNYVRQVEIKVSSKVTVEPCVYL